MDGLGTGVAQVGGSLQVLYVLHIADGAFLVGHLRDALHLVGLGLALLAVELETGLRLEARGLGGLHPGGILLLLALGLHPRQFALLLGRFQPRALGSVEEGQAEAHLEAHEVALLEAAAVNVVGVETADEQLRAGRQRDVGKEFLPRDAHSLLCHALAAV